MIIVKLMGGLGNQMFQYAAARRLAHFNNTTLKVDLNWFHNIREVDTFREYALDKFAIQEKFATCEEIEELTVQKQRFVERLALKALGRKLEVSSSYIGGKGSHFDPSVLALPSDVYLDGYWQSEKYFDSIENIIRKEFTLKTTQSGKNKEIANMILSCESVSLHVRRGDYISNPITNQAHGVCDLDYFFNCIKKIAEFVKTPYFFIFSDDLEWSRKHLKLDYPTTFVGHNGTKKPCEDLRLMSQCRHHIIANSSFSWWGAWLNEKPDKIVIAPKRWFNDSSRDTEDLIPDNWVRI